MQQQIQNELRLSPYLQGNHRSKTEHCRLTRSVFLNFGGGSLSLCLSVCSQYFIAFVKSFGPFIVAHTILVTNT